MMAGPRSQDDQRQLQLAIVADATPEVGAGHVMRCAVLADAWQRASLGTAVVFGTVSIPFVIARLEALNIAVLARERFRAEDAILVVDSYSDGVRARGGRASALLRVLVDDVGGSTPPSFHVVWNPNVYGSVDLYPEFAGILITGIDAVPVRGDLDAWHGGHSSAIGLTLGGGRASSLAVAVAAELEAGLDGRVLATTRALLPTTPAPIDPFDLWGQLAKCSAIVCAAGATLWEASVVGVPVIAVAVAENQLSGLAWAREQGVPAVDLTRLKDARSAVRAILEALPKATPLPPLRGGAELVASRLAQIALGASAQ